MAATKKVVKKAVEVVEETEDEAAEVYEIEACGVAVELRQDVAEDWEVMEALVALQDESTDDMARTRATVGLVKSLFGPDYERVKRELREANEGSLTPDIVMGFVTEVFEQVAELKNS